VKHAKIYAIDLRTKIPYLPTEQTTKNKSFLWVYLSDWIIYKNKIKILDCENDYDYSNVLNYMKGELLIKIKENTINKRIDFIFTGGYKLSLINLFI
jgi:hypothetical protein